MQAAATLITKDRSFLSLALGRVKAGCGVARKIFRLGAPTKDIDAIANLKVRASPSARPLLPVTTQHQLSLRHPPDSCCEIHRQRQSAPTYH